MTDHLAYALQLALGAVFAAAVLPKLRDPRAFAETVAAYELVPRRAAGLVAGAVIGVETFLVVAFLTGWAMWLALPLAALTLLAFVVAVGLNLRRGRQVACGCFGNRAELISGRSLARLALLLAGCAALVLTLAAGASPETVGDLADEGASALWYVLDVAGIAAAAVVLCAWALSAPELAAIGRWAFERTAQPPRGEETTEVA